MDRLLPVRGRGKTTPCFRLPALRHGCGVTELESLFHAEAQCSQRLARTALASSLRSLRLCVRTLAFNTAGGDSAFRDLQVSRAGSTGHFWHQASQKTGLRLYVSSEGWHDVIVPRLLTRLPLRSANWPCTFPAPTSRLAPSQLQVAVLVPRLPLPRGSNNSAARIVASQ